MLLKLGEMIRSFLRVFIKEAKKTTITQMALPQHERTLAGTFRRERADSLAGNLAKEYPEFRDVDPRTKLGTLEDRYGVDSLNGVRKALREDK